jgi:tetratricopeptide (TPR) repeat protein
MKMPTVFARFLLTAVAAGGLASSAVAADGAEASAASTAPKIEDALNPEEIRRAYSNLQEQLRAMQLAVERSREEAATAATRYAETTSTRLQLIEESLSAQRAREFEAMQKTNRLMVALGGAFAGVGLLAMVFTAWLQWRATGRLTELVAGASANRSFIPAEPRFAIEASPEAGARLSGAIERLEKRILELEHATAAPLKDVAHAGADVSSAPDGNGNAAAPSDKTAQITLLLGKGQSLLNLDKTEEAVACFDEVLALDENNTDALVKKGVALERQRKLNEAIECYDRAIAADSSVAIAYLYKGGICNRLERFSEALECYEQALRAQEKRREA